MPYKIYSINPVTHEVIATDLVTKEQVRCTIPVESRGSSKDKLAYIKSRTDAHDRNKRIWKLKPYLIYGTIMLETAYILVRLLHGS